jgi:hypothetical protein
LLYKEVSFEDADLTNKKGKTGAKAGDGKHRAGRHGKFPLVRDRPFRRKFQITL